MVTLGTSGIDVFPLNLGGNVFGWTADEAQSFAVLDAFVDGGGNFIDTADGYSAWVPGNAGGESEAIIGRWLQRRGRRDDVVIATKVGKHPDLQGLGADTIVAAVEASLRRLGTDHIDLYYAHADDRDTPLEESLAAFQSLVQAGKVRAVGGSNYSAARTAEVLAIQDREGMARWSAIQPHYNLVERARFEAELQGVAQREGLATLPYYALASGFLTGKYREPAPVDDPTSRAAKATTYLDDRGRAILGALDEVAAEHDAAVTAVSIAWLKAQPTVAAPIASARTVEQLGALFAGVRLELTADDLRRLDDASRPAAD